MRKLLGFLLIPALILGLSWFAAVIYLQQSGTEVTGQTLLIGFVALPAVLLACWFGIKALFSALANRSATTQSAADTTNDSPASAAASPEVQLPSLAILSADIHTAGASDPDALLAGLQEGELRPAMSERFVNQDGLPVMASLDDDLDTELAAEFVSQWLSAASDAHPAASDPDRAARMLALLETPVARNLDLLSSIPPEVQTPHNGAAQTAKRPLLIKIFAERGWEDMVEAWLRKQLASLEGFTPGFVRADPERPELQLDALRVSGAFSSELARIPAGSLMMLLACDSRGSETWIERADYDGTLFDARRQHGSIPGEAASVVLIGHAERIPAEIEALAELKPAAWGTRQKAVDAAGRTDVTLLGTLTTQLLDKHQLSADEIGSFVSDCDQRSPWVAEAASLISSTLPALDPVADHLSLGRALGDTGAASSVLALACAAACVREKNMPGLVASVADKTQRSLALLRPLQATT